MERTTDPGLDRRIESLTAHLLECYEELDLIYRLTRGLKSTLDAQRSAELILREAMEIFEAEMGWIVPGGPAPFTFDPLLQGTHPDAVARLRRSPMWELVEQGKSKIFYSVHQELSLDGEDLPDSLLCAAIRTETTLYGTLCVGRRGPERMFTARDLKLSDVLTSQAAIAIENLVLQRRRIEEEQARARIEEEMRLARDIQSKLLPRSAPQLPGYDIAGMGLPAESVGGDYYDFISIDERRLAVCLGDVTGHGMPAALLMANLQATIRSQALAAVSPAECMRRSNRLLYQNTDTGRFATCFYAVLEADSGRLTYSNAAQNPPLLLRSGGGQAALETGGTMLGAFEQPSYEEAAAVLEPGDILVLYSDGVTETFDFEQREFGLDGLEAAVERARDRPAAGILDEILAAARAHARGRAPSDDMTLVVVRRSEPLA
jgi:sigma-B regulation protein RsbU (phosphoserine phosphatase)